MRIRGIIGIKKANIDILAILDNKKAHTPYIGIWAKLIIGIRYCGGYLMVYPFDSNNLIKSFKDFSLRSFSVLSLK